MSNVRLKIDDMNVANVEERIIDLYIQYNPALKDTSKRAVVRSIIESELLCRPIESKKDIEEAKALADNAYYKDLGDWVEGWIRDKVKDKLPICRNCTCLQENSYCPVLGAFINPNSKSCTNF